ncbi:uncharacterized protein FA14DRAFT_51995 [Meira miltonrushii]|uniref:Arrestin-like N-terminal domain-containing protein n=1 Tax=Meira miltonrushii TaxID=1280837 RepID=A0A316VIH4_9BASI|nr:uncharacterized protein FA14DRAFT_51995 [Meira miltonrushii]PWN36123.1 hypothetical protein FA14DRAFT_51995 [Meira miltonrushii]
MGCYEFGGRVFLSYSNRHHFSSELMTKMLGFNKPVVHVDLVEPLIFLRKPPSWSAYASTSSSTLDQIGSCQLRGVVRVESKKSLDQLKRIQVSFIGKSRSMNWENGVAREEELRLHDQSINLILPIEQQNDRDLFPYSYTAPFSISVPSNLPPTIDTEFGRVDYQVSATVYGGEGEGNTIAKSAVNKDVRVVYDAANPNHREEETSHIGRMHTFEGDWQECLHWKWTCMTNVSTTGGYVPLQICLAKVNKQTSKNVWVKSIRISLTEQTEVTSASVTSPTVVRRSWNLLAMGEKEETLLPLQSNTKFGQDLIAAAQRANNTDIRAEKALYSQSTAESSHAEHNLSNPDGPWSLGWDVQLPVCAKTRCQSTVNHPCSPVRVFHMLNMILQFQKDDEREIFEVKTSMPYIVRSIYLTDPYSQLPCYWCACFKSHPYEAREERSEGGILTYHDPHPQSMIVQETPKETQASTNWLLSALKSRTTATTETNSISHQDRRCTAEKWIELTANGGLPPPSYALPSTS